MKILLHVCCGICAAGAAKQLQEEGHQVTGYFFNPNIHPQDEYALRLEAARKVATELGFTLIAGEYDPVKWMTETAQLADEKEGGLRCHLCYRIRLQQTHEYMKQSGADVFTTTLTIGPRKSAVIINEIGGEIGGDRFLARDFKKKDWFKKANNMARQWGLYRQNYCGCIYTRPQKAE